MPQEKRKSRNDFLILLEWLEEQEKPLSFYEIQEKIEELRHKKRFKFYFNMRTYSLHGQIVCPILGSDIRVCITSGILKPKHDNPFEYEVDKEILQKYLRGADAIYRT